MSEPLEMTLDFGPYFRLLTRKPDPSKMTDAEIAAKLKKVRRVVDRTRPYAGTIAMITFMSCPAIGYTAMALGAAGPFFWGLGGAYLLFQGFKPLIKAAVLRAHSDVNSFEGEATKRTNERELLAIRAEAAEAEAKVARALALQRKAQDAFDSALNDGLPLERKIAVSKSPLKLKPVAQAAQNFMGEADEAVPQASPARPAPSAQ